jgi:phosphate-selective porin
MAVGAAAMFRVLAAASPAAAAEPMGPYDPLAGFSDGTAFVRSPDNMFVLLPNGRLNVDAYAFARPTNQMPTDTVLLRRARLELGGWIGPWFFFSIAGDFALGAPSSADPQPQSFIAATDDYVGVAPFGNRLILQVGQFDAPFTLENRTSDKFIDFMERPITVRAFGVPSNKEVGGMLHGLPFENQFLYYSFGAFNGDGQNFKNVDNNIDAIGRAFISPFALTRIKALENVSVGGSMWLGRRGDNGNLATTQTTQGAFKFFDPKWTAADMKTPLELHQNGSLRQFAFELNLPIAHRFGFRFEYVRRTQELTETDASKASAGMLTVLPLGHAQLDGWAAYGEAWVWILGDDRIIGAPGLQMPYRLSRFSVKPPDHGLMLLARVDNLKETLTNTDSKGKNPNGNPNMGTTRVIAPELGVNYWYSKRFRATFNYVLNVIEGDTKTIAGAQTKNGGHAAEHEFLFRLGIGL